MIILTEKTSKMVVEAIKQLNDQNLPSIAIGDKPPFKKLKIYKVGVLEPEKEKSAMHFEHEGTSYYIL